MGEEGYGLSNPSRDNDGADFFLGVRVFVGIFDELSSLDLRVLGGLIQALVVGGDRTDDVTALLLSGLLSHSSGGSRSMGSLKDENDPLIVCLISLGIAVRLRYFMDG
jgi:hypothetical protein